MTAAVPTDTLPPPRDPRHYRRGIYLLPSIITVGNLFCGYACIVFAMRQDLVTAAPFIGFAFVLDMLDGRIARLTNTTSAFGREFDSLADVISFGVAPAMLALAWGLSELGRVGWAVGFVYVTAAAMRLARFNLQTHATTDKRYFVGMPSPSAAGVIAATIYAWPYPLEGLPAGLAVAVVLVPAILMVTTIKFRSFKTINFGWTPSYIKIFLVAGIIALVAVSPRVTLVVVAYGYLLSAFLEWTVNRFKSSSAAPAPSSET